MRPVDSSNGHQGGPAVRGQARAAEVHAAKAEGRSPSRAHWRAAAASTPAVEVSFSPEATAAIDETATTTAPAPPVESPVVESTGVATDATSAAALVAEAIVASSIITAEPGMYVDVVV